MVKVKDLKGKKVYGKKGMLIGEVEDVEFNVTTWTVDSVNVKLDAEVAKLYDFKGGFMSKSVVPLPGYLFGEVMGDRVILKKPIKDVNALREYVETSHAVM